jgi:hypothetical protein
LNDILRQLQNALRELKGFTDEIELFNSIALTKNDLGSGLKIFPTTTPGAAFGANEQTNTVHVARGAYQDRTGGWVATSPVASILEFDSDGNIKIYKDTDLGTGGYFIPTPVGTLLPPGLSPDGSIITITNNYVVEQGVTVILADASASSLNVTLPPAAGSEGRSLYVKKIDSSANVVTVSGDAGIDGDSDMDLIAEDESIEVVCDSSEWWII